MNSLFQKKVYEVVKKIPKGKVLSYRETTEKAGFPKAWRAVGNILSKNKDIKIPCYRVIRSNGSIGGFNGGVKRKMTLLKKEGVLIRNIKVVR